MSCDEVRLVDSQTNVAMSVATFTMIMNSLLTRLTSHGRGRRVIFGLVSTRDGLL